MFAVDSDPSLVERIARDMSAAPVDVALGTMEAAWTFGPAVPALLSELRLPIIAINPDNSSTNVDSLHSFGIEVQLMPGVGHFPMLENPHAFNLQLLEAIKALAGSPPDFGSRKNLGGFRGNPSRATAPSHATKSTLQAINLGCSTARNSPCGLLLSTQEYMKWSMIVAYSLNGFFRGLC
jgi:hypothetical protein